MDRKGIIVLVISFIMLVVWAVLREKLYPTPPPSAATNLVTRATNQVAGTNGRPTISNPPTNAAPTPAPAPTPRPVTPEQKEVLEQVTVDGNTYVFTSHGGGLKHVELNPKKYPEQLKRNGDGQTGGAILNRGALTPVLALGGHPSLQEDGFYQLTKIAGGVRAEKTLSNGLHIVKEFRPTTNYLIKATTRIENTTGQAVILPTREWTAGTASLIHSQEDPMQLGAFVYDGNKVTHVDDAWFANRTLGCLPGTPRERFVSTGPAALWAAAHNRFFVLATVPTNKAPEVRAHKLDLNLAEKDPTRAKGIEVALVYRAESLDPKAALTEEFTIYAGPKEYDGLARIGTEMKNNLDYVMKFNGFFGFFSKILLLSMTGIHDFLKLPYGWAIIVITVIIKLLFWPLTKASTRSMKRMSELQPEMKKIQEKFKDDPQKMNKKMMEFMKENKVNPLGGCLPMLIQIPVFFGFYYMIQSAIELRGASFLWAWDLSVPDTVAMLGGFPVNVLPIIMGVTMFWQAQLTPMSPTMDATQQKIMKYMPLIFLFVLYNMSSGLTLYWTVQNILTIVQTKLTKTSEKPATPAAPVAKTATASPARKK